MKLVHVAAGALSQTPLAWEENKNAILQAVEAARSKGASLVCFPELSISGYNCEDMFHAPGVAETSWSVLKELAPHTKGLVVSVGLPLRHRNVLFNTACLLVDGRIAGFAAKRYLAGEGIHYEPRWFKPWPAGVVATVERDGERYPFGDIYFDVGGVKIGYEICEDAWAADRPGAELASKGVDVILNPSASHFAFGKFEVRRRFILEGSRAFGVSYIYANMLGNEAGRAIYDGGAVIASAGNVLAQGPRFSFEPFLITTAVVDVDSTRMQQARNASFQPQVAEDDKGRVDCPFRWPSVEPSFETPAPPEWETGPYLKEEEFARAEALALFDYMRKSRARGFVVSLSGGADSSTCAVLVGLMAIFGITELGRERFLQRLGYFKELEEAGPGIEDIVHRLLLCVYQSTRNSSETTRRAARRVAGAVGAEYLELDVQELVDKYVTLVAEAIGREITWDRDDLALQNIQARVRAPSVWLLANLRGAILLSTSNRSEAAVGYATMDGDTCGGLAPLAGIDKSFIRHWLSWMEKKGPEGADPIPALEAVTSQKPTAELKPPEAGQTDEGDLMPYEVLDEIEKAAIRDKLMPLEVLRTVRVRFPRYSEEELGAWVERFFRLWCRNQWKRERYAPSFHLDDENLDPKTWCRFPILSSGFERELRELREYLKRK